MPTEISAKPDKPLRLLPLGDELTRRLLTICHEYCEDDGGCHGPDHTERVHQTALHIGCMMEADLEVLSASALLHDIGRTEESARQGKICHAEYGAKIARKLLGELDFEAPRIEKICHCIATHRFRGTAVPESMEAKILFDADKLDSIGAIGIGRAFLFAGQVGARLHNSHLDINNTAAYSLEDTAYREFRLKLRKIKTRMLTEVGRKLAQERHEFMAIFFKRMDEEVGKTMTRSQ